MNPDGTHRYGERELRKGECQFFLNPGEYLESGFNKIHTLEENDCLLLKAKTSFTDGDVQRKAGEVWMIRGPRNFIPTVDIEILEKRSALPLGDNEGVYVRSKRTGEVRLEKGKQTFILQPDEVFWNKELSQDVETLIAYNHSGTNFIP